MRRALALATLMSLAAGAAGAETWTKYTDAAGGTAWSYDSDYTYKDKASGRLVVMQAVSKPASNLGPGAPGKADGVGSVVAIDCAMKNMISMASYKPSQALTIADTWRRNSPKKAEGTENAALLAAVCPHIDHVPVK